MALQQALGTNIPKTGVRLPPTAPAAPVTPPPDAGAQFEAGAEQKRKELEPLQQRISGLETEQQTLIGERTQFEAEQKAREAAGRAGIQQQYAQRRAEAPLGQELAEKVQQEKDFFFRPSQEDGMMMAALGSLIAVLGTSIGRGGKGNAMAALSGMNGMMQGYQQGRDDIFKKEKSAFETNAKALTNQITAIRKSLEDYERLLVTDKESAEAKLQEDLSKQGADFLKARAGREGVLKLLPELRRQEAKLKEELGKYESKARDARTKAQAVAESIKFRQEEAEKNRLARTETMLLANQLALDRQRERQDARGSAPSKKADEGRVLAPPEARKIEAFDSAALALERLKEKWKPEYAQMGMPAGLGAGMVYEAARRGVPLTMSEKTTQEAVDWWAAYEALQAPQRHALFGSAFTKGEQDSWKTFSAQKTDSADTVKTMVERQIKHSKQQASGLRSFYGDAGYRVPAARPRDWTSTEFTPPPRDESLPPAGGAPAAAAHSPAPTGNKPPGAPDNARQAPDGNWYAPDPQRPGKFIKY